MYRKIAVLFLAIVVFGALAALPAFAEGAAHDYVGNSKCKMCHKGESKGMVWENWLETKHAKAMETLDAEKGEDKNPECLKCHTTGFGTATGYNPETPNEDFANVGCESCHGAGADYKAMKVMKDREQAIAAGMILPTEETCKGCHNEASPTFKGFNYEEALATGTHNKAAAEEAPAETPVKPEAEGETGK
ncbi:cytochrome c family protein [bacterium]|nr:cytochrome c family protein [bacterium]